MTDKVIDRTDKDSSSDTRLLSSNAEYQRIKLKSGPSLLRSLRDQINRYEKREDIDKAAAIKDFMTDIRHLCDVYELNYYGIESEALAQYRKEAREYLEDREK